MLRISFLALDSGLFCIDEYLEWDSSFIFIKLFLDSWLPVLIAPVPPFLVLFYETNLALDASE